MTDRSNHATPSSVVVCLPDMRTVDTVALVDGLRTGRLRAALDVHEEELLPAAHPLWDMPNVLVSPHMAGDSPITTVRAFELAGDQVRRSLGESR